MRYAFKLGALAAAAVTAGSALTIPSTTLADTLTATSWGGAYSMSQRKAYYEPFMKETGHTVLEDEWAGDLAVVRAMVETGNYKWHVIDAETNDVLAGCDEGVLEPLDYGKIGVKPEEFIDGAALECGVGTIIWTTIFAYDKTKFPTDGPQNWADFWNVEKFPGKRGLYKSPSYNLEFALQADGVPIDQIYSVMRTPEGVDRAFAKLGELKPHIVWWETGAQAPQLLADGEVSMTTAWNGRIYSAIKDEGRPFEIVWHGHIYDLDYWVIPKDHPEKDLAYEFIAFASRKDRQGDQTNFISYGNTVKGTEGFINPDILPHLPSAHLEYAIKQDAEYWAENNEELQNRFNAWVAQ
jgi:putative spermidine/putrescine transport system substrate-binding protein